MTEAPTFNRDVAPIVFAHCAPCHRPGEAGPFSLLTFADVKARARLIAEVVQRRSMPPWPPEAGQGVFAGERRLRDEQVAVIRRWVDAGAVEGDRADRPPPPGFPEGWGLGPPDLVLDTPQPFPLGPEGTDVFWNLLYRSPTDRTRHVRAVEIRLNDRRVGHHANLLIDRTRQSRALDGRTGLAGFPGMDVSFESAGFDPDSHFLFWKPGTAPYNEPTGMAWRLDRRTDLVLNLHLRPTGKPEKVAPQIGLYFTDEVPTLHPMLVQLEHDAAIDIAAGARDVVVTDELVLPVAVDVLAVYPHAHYLGKDVQGEAVLPDGRREWLIHIKDWDVNWQAVYRLAAPLRLPKGTRLTMRWTYDNTADNVRNPHRPPRRVRAGDRAEDEMGHLWLQVLPRPEADPAATDPRLLLQEALMQRRLVKSPTDASARYNLGATLLALGRTEDAVRELEEAARRAPRRATVHTTLGSAYQAQGESERALRAYREAVRLDPTYVNAQFDLGQLLVATGHEAEALRPLREAARLEPEDASIRAQLGAALQRAGETGPAIESLRRALALDPDQVLARFNLAQALAGRGELEPARAEYEALLQRQPDDPDAHRGLGLVLAGLDRVPEAVAAFRAVLALQPDDLVAHDALGQLLLGVAAKASGTARSRSATAVEAIAHLRVVVRARPGDADAWNNLGSALAMQGNLAEAVRSFERALAVEPAHAAALANLARARGKVPRG